MVRSALVATTVLFLGFGFWVMQESAFLIPYRRLLWETTGEALGVFAGALFVNLFAAETRSRESSS